MSRIVAEVQIDDLHKHTYEFYTSECGRFWLCAFYDYTRKTKRHKYVVGKWWELHRRNTHSGIDLSAQWTFDVAIADAKHQIQSRVRFVSDPSE